MFTEAGVTLSVTIRQEMSQRSRSRRKATSQNVFGGAYEQYREIEIDCFLQLRAAALQDE